MPKHERHDENIEEDRREIDQSIKRLKLDNSSSTFSQQFELEQNDDEQNELLKMNKYLGFLHWCRSNRKTLPNKEMNHPINTQQTSHFQQPSQVPNHKMPQNMQTMQRSYSPIPEFFRNPSSNHNQS